MMTATPLVSPTDLGFWMRMVREASDLSQDALSEISGVTSRTIQRVEAGKRSSLATRRCLARGLGYDNYDIFDDPRFAKTVTSFRESLRAERIMAAEAQYPDHVRINAAPIDRGTTLVERLGSTDAWVFHCEEGVAPEGQLAAAALFDELRDYGDVWDELTFTNRTAIASEFDAMLCRLAALGLRAFGADRKARIVPSRACDEMPLAWRIGYLAILPHDRVLDYLLVPKRS
jgi:transcriptional regulator with XRE-family HTH domain